MRAIVLALLGALAAASVGACFESAFTCAANVDCDSVPGGRCEENGRCSYPDARCGEDGRVWGPYAGAGLDGRCIGAGASEGGTEGEGESEGEGEGESGSSPAACAKIDFLFVVANSHAMAGPQAKLEASFLPLWSSVGASTAGADYHVMVVDSDAVPLNISGSLSCPGDGADCTCTPEPDCCLALCHGGSVSPTPTMCGGASCDSYQLPSGCAYTLGAGRSENAIGTSCGLLDGQRWFTNAQPSPQDAFACAVAVGTDGGDSATEAMAAAVSNNSSAASCNDGFLRDDAILVVTILAADEDDGEGDMDLWRQSLINAKHGDETAVVVLALVGDTDVASTPCGEDDADGLPQLRQFASSFEYGAWGSICESSYNAFFANSVDLIEQACASFEPPTG